MKTLKIVIKFLINNGFTLSKNGIEFAAANSEDPTIAYSVHPQSSDAQNPEVLNFEGFEDAFENFSNRASPLLPEGKNPEFEVTEPTDQEPEAKSRENHIPFKIVMAIPIAFVIAFCIFAVSTCQSRKDANRKAPKSAEQLLQDIRLEEFESRKENNKISDPDHLAGILAPLVYQSINPNGPNGSENSTDYEYGYKAAIWDTYLEEPRYRIQENEGELSLWKEQDIPTETLERIIIKKQEEENLPQ